MKRYITRPVLALLTAAACLTGTISCKDYLEVTPDGLTTPDVVFGSVAGATSTVLGVYDLLSGDQTYGVRLSMYFPYDSDEMQSSPGTDDGGRRAIARYSALATNSEITNPWNNLYQGIERANICAYYIPRMSQYTDASSADNATAKRLYGEVLTLRAQFYYELVRNWGDVPAPFEPSAAGQDFRTPKVDRNVIMDRLLADLALAETLLPWRTEAPNTYERVSKGAAKALRARIALARGGYALRQDGQVNRPSDYLNFYTIARDECSGLMARRDQHTLNSSFEETFRSINELRSEAAGEIVFEVAMAGGSAASDSKLGYYNGPRMNSSLRYGTSSGAIVALPTYFYAFDSVDTRRDVTLAPYTVESNDLQKGVVLTTVYDGKFRRDWRIPALPGTTNYLGYNWPLIRFADVLLMYAEAENELNGPTAPAKAALQEVRNRAYRGNLGRAGLTINSKADMFNAVVNERFLELGGEGIRKYDLIRWNLLDSKIADTRAGLRALRDSSGIYANVPRNQFYRVVNGVVQYRSFYRPSPAPRSAGVTGFTPIKWRANVTDAFITGFATSYQTNRQLLPIPQTTLDLNPNLVQNPGY